MPVTGFNREKDANDLLKLLQRYRGQPLNFPPSPQLPEGNSLIWVQVPAGGIPAISGPHPGKPGKADCLVFVSAGENDEPVQPLDMYGNPATVTVRHYGPTAIPELDHNDNPRMIFAAWQSGKLTAIVDYCPPS